MADGSMLPDWLTNILSAIGASGVTYFFTRRKQTAEAQTNELDNVQKAITIWRKSAEDLRSEIKELQREYTELQDSVDKLKFENETLKKQVAELKVENEQLKKLIK